MKILLPYIAAVAAVLVTLCAWCGLDRFLPQGSPKRPPTNMATVQQHTLGFTFGAVALVSVGVVCLAAVCSYLASQYGVIAGLAPLLVLFSLPSTLGMSSSRKLCLTLTTPQLLLDVIDAFKKEFPFLNMMGTDFRGSPLKLNQKYIAHIRSLPTASTYDPTTGYANGANAARGLLADVPVTVNQHPTCPLKWLHLDEIKDVKENYQGAIADTGYVLSKGFVDVTLGKATHRYFTKEVVKAVADCDYDWLQELTEKGNTQGMLPTGRVLLVSSAVASVLAVDPRMISKDYAGQLLDGRGYRQWRNVGGFALIQEYPDMPTNNVAALTGVTATAATNGLAKNGHGLETGDPVVISVSGGGAGGLVVDTRYWAIKVDANSFKLATSYANAVAGTEIDVTSDSSGGHLTLALTENLRAIAFDRRAFAMLSGIPEGFNSQVASALGIPLSMVMESLTAPGGMSMGMAKWQQGGTGDLFVCPTFVYGTHAGKQGDTTTSAAAAANAAGSGLDYAAIRCTSGAS